MIEYKNMDITTVTSGVIGHGVNCRHAFGSGVAGAIRAKFPDVRRRYMEMPSGPDMLGVVHFITINSELTIANLYTQVDYGYDGKVYADVDTIAQCFEYLCEYADMHEITNVYIPQIGCKRGGLDWDSQVLPVINKVADRYQHLTITICIYEG